MLFSDQVTFKAEYIALLPEINEKNTDKMVVFSHNDVQENNIMVKWQDADHNNIVETKLIDFEYSSLNFRGADLAGYLVENMIDNKVDHEPFYAYHHDRFPDFTSQDPKTPVNTMIRVYLETYYNEFCDKNAASAEERQKEFEEEFASMKEQIMKMTLHFHLFWTSWSILMIEPQVNSLFEADKVTDDIEKIKATLDEMQSYYITYAKFRLELYFSWRQILLPESKSKLRN